MLEKPYPNHQTRVNHLMKDCGLLKKWLVGNLKRNDPKEKPESEGGIEEEKEEGYPEHNILMFFGGPIVYESRCKQKLSLREVMAVKPTTPKFL